MNNQVKKTGYLDCFSGVSGDMMLGALIDCGLELDFLRAELEKLNLPGLKIETSKKTVNAILACKVNVNSERRQDLRTLPDILRIFENSDLDRDVTEKAGAVFTELAEAEAKVHGISIDKVHFHEVGALDTIVDIVGVVLGMKYLGIVSLICSPLPTGHGFVKCDHGLLPLPAPAVCEILKGVPTYGIELKQELITPTGAALIKGLVNDFGSLPPMTIQTTGYGAGSRILENKQPNLLRLIVGEQLSAAESQLVEVIETNLDDWSPEGFPYLCELLFQKGALDVTLTSTQMKKGRPGYILQAIGTADSAHILKQVILTETSAIGLRFRKEGRQTLPRKMVTVSTKWGEISAKQVQTPGGTVIYPEYEQCRQVALNLGVPLKEIYHEVQRFTDTK